MKLQNLISSVLVLPLTGWAGVLVTENFDYADGDLTGNPAWTAHSGGGKSYPSLQFYGCPVSWKWQS
jgi:hypothetical protein